MEKPTSEQKIKNIINQIAGEEEVDISSARTQLHKFVCSGKCNWYTSRKPSERFDRLGLTEQQRHRIGEIVGQVMEGTTADEARREIHAVLCHSLPAEE